MVLFFWKAVAVPAFERHDREVLDGVAVVQEGVGSHHHLTHHRQLRIRLDVIHNLHRESCILYTGGNRQYKVVFGGQGLDSWKWDWEGGGGKGHRNPPPPRAHKPSCAGGSRDKFCSSLSVSGIFISCISSPMDDASLNDVSRPWGGGAGWRYVTIG